MPDVHDVRIRRLKRGSIMFARRIEAGAVVEWTASPAEAGRFDRAVADGLLALIARAAERGQPTGRFSIVPLDGAADAAEIAGAGAAVEDEPRLERDEETGEVTLGDIDAVPRYMPGTPAADIVPDAGRPVLRLAFACGPFGPQRAAIVRDHSDYSGAVREAVMKPDSAAAPYFAVRRQIEAHDAATAASAAAARETLATLRAEREAAEADLASPGLAARLRDIDARIAAAKQHLDDFSADRGLLEQLLAKHRPAAERAIRAAAAAARRARLRELLEQGRDLAGHVAATMAEELAAIHEVWTAARDLEMVEVAHVAEAAAVNRLIGPPPSAK